MEIFTEQVFSGISCFFLFVCLLAFFSSEPLKKKFGLKKTKPFKSLSHADDFFRQGSSKISSVIFSFHNLLSFEI